MAEKTTIGLAFSKVSSVPSSGLTKGTIYFDDTNRVIKIATSATTTVTYAGIQDASFDTSTNVLNIVKPDGTVLSVDFSGLDNIKDVNNLRAGIGFEADTNSYGNSGISDTNYLNSGNSSTVIGALKTLDTAVHNVKRVITFGGKSGDITLKNGGDNNGDINLTMNGKQLNAAIVGLGSAAFTNSSDYDISGAAAAVLGASDDASTAKTVYGLDAKIDAIKADSSVSLVETTGSGDVSKVYTIKQGDVSVGSINIPKDFLVKSGDVKTCEVKDQPIEGLNVGDKYLDFVVNTKDGSGTESHIYIPVKDLTDIYTGGSTAAIDVSVSGSNVITATLKNSAVATEHLDSSVVAALNKANSAVQTVTGETAVTNSSYIAVAVNASKDDNNNVTLSTTANVTMKDVSTATSSNDGLATAYDVQHYVQTYVAEQLRWTQFAE